MWNFLLDPDFDFVSYLVPGKIIKQIQYRYR